MQVHVGQVRAPPEHVDPHQLVVGEPGGLLLVGGAEAQLVGRPDLAAHPGALAVDIGHAGHVFVLHHQLGLVAAEPVVAEQPVPREGPERTAELDHALEVVDLVVAALGQPGLADDPPRDRVAVLHQHGRGAPDRPLPPQRVEGAAGGVEDIALRQPVGAGDIAGDGGARLARGGLLEGLVDPAQPVERAVRAHQRHLAAGQLEIAQEQLGIVLLDLEVELAAGRRVVDQGRVVAEGQVDVLVADRVEHVLRLLGVEIAEQLVEVALAGVDRGGDLVSARGAALGIAGHPAIAFPFAVVLQRGQVDRRDVEPVLLGDLDLAADGLLAQPDPHGLHARRQDALHHEGAARVDRHGFAHDVDRGAGGGVVGIDGDRAPGDRDGAAARHVLALARGDGGAGQHGAGLARGAARDRQVAGLVVAAAGVVDPQAVGHLGRAGGGHAPVGQPVGGDRHHRDHPARVAQVDHAHLAAGDVGGIVRGGAEGDGIARHVGPAHVAGRDRQPRLDVQPVEPDLDIGGVEHPVDAAQLVVGGAVALEEDRRGTGLGGVDRDHEALFAEIAVEGLELGVLAARQTDGDPGIGLPAIGGQDALDQRAIGVQRLAPGGGGQQRGDRHAHRQATEGGTPAERGPVLSACKE